MYLLLMTFVTPSSSSHTEWYVDKDLDVLRKQLEAAKRASQSWFPMHGPVLLKAVIVKSECFDIHDSTV